MYIYIYIYTHTCITCIHLVEPTAHYEKAWRWTRPWPRRRDGRESVIYRRREQTGWSKHGFSRIPSNSSVAGYSIIQYDMM